MAGLPVTIRLLDPPLHEFLPDRGGRPGGRARAIERTPDLEELEHTLERVHDLDETNPMLGTRGVPAGDPAPGDLRDAGAGDHPRGARRGRALGAAPKLEIMIPLVAYEQELELMREMVEASATRRNGRRSDLTVGTMIELPRACFVADRIAEVADFFSFGTNDLTQTALGFSRDDVEGSFLPPYIERKIVDRSPFETIDRPGVGWLVRLAAWVGARQAGPQARHLRRARRRPRVDRLLRDGRARLRVVLAVPRAAGHDQAR